MGESRGGEPGHAGRRPVSDLLGGWGSPQLAPREHLLIAGPQALGDEELLMVILGTGPGRGGVAALAHRIAEELGDVRALAGRHPCELLRVLGLGEAKAARLAAAVELGRRVCSRRWQLGEPFSSSLQVFKHLHTRLRDEKREHFAALLLDARHRLIGEVEISRGSLVASLVHPREVFRPAVQRAAAAIICVHNHPSGDPTCSREDIAITERLHRAGRTLGIELLDHLIVGDGCYFSFLDQGISPFAPDGAGPRDGARATTDEGGP